MNKLLWSVVLTQLLNTLRFMNSLGLGGQGERQSCPPPCLRVYHWAWSFLLQLSRLIIKLQGSLMSVSALGLQVCANSISACLTFYMDSGTPNQVLQALIPTESSLQSMDILFSPWNHATLGWLTKKKQLPFFSKLTYKLKDYQKLSQIINSDDNC